MYQWGNLSVACAPRLKANDARFDVIYHHIWAHIRDRHSRVSHTSLCHVKMNMNKQQYLPNIKLCVRISQYSPCVRIMMYTRIALLQVHTMTNWTRMLARETSSDWTNATYVRGTGHQNIYMQIEYAIVECFRREYAHRLHPILSLPYGLFFQQFTTDNTGERHTNSGKLKRAHGTFQYLAFGFMHQSLCVYNTLNTFWIYYFMPFFRQGVTAFCYLEMFRIVVQICSWYFHCIRNWYWPFASRQNSLCA